MYLEYMSDERQSIRPNPPGPNQLNLKGWLGAERRATALHALVREPTLTCGARLAARRWAPNALRETCAELPCDVWSDAEIKGTLQDRVSMVIRGIRCKDTLM